ncbi:MAG: hypothetical protein IKO78_01850 [Bacilli bacterium]|nr:hypothetical protein [Bacilli bacterium]
MINETMARIKQDQILYNYLKYHSYWYTRILLNENSIKEMINEMKKEYKLTTEDKLKDLNNKLELVSSLLEVLS